MARTTEARRAGVQLPGQPRALIPVLAFGTSLGLFLLISYLLCILFYLLFPGLVLNHAVLTLFLPGFKLLDWRSFLLGAVESFGYGWYVALIFGPLYNFFAARFR
jgi:2TM family of unknown function (DUF5676)